MAFGGQTNTNTRAKCENGKLEVGMGRAGYGMRGRRPRYSKKMNGQVESDGKYRMVERFSDHLQDLKGVSKMMVERLIRMPHVHPWRTCSVVNIFLRSMYDLKKAEYTVKHGAMVDERIMFYTTSAKHAYQVAKFNFDWRHPRGGHLGAGVAFSTDPDTAYSMCHPKSRDLATIIVKVLMVRSCQGYSFMDFPPTNFDTVCDKNKKVFVKFHDNEFLPIHVIFFDQPNYRSPNKTDSKTSKALHKGPFTGKVTNKFRRNDRVRKL